MNKRTYTAIDALYLTFQASPVVAAVHVMLSALQAVMPTAVMALATANFVDTAMNLLQGNGIHSDIYVPLILLLLVLGVFTTMGSVIQLVKSNIGIKLQRKLKPAMLHKHSALDFKYIENNHSWELISRVTRDPATSVMNGFDAFIRFGQTLLSVFSVLVLIVTQVWWAALTILAFSAPMVFISLRAGKKNYHAGRDAERFNRRTEYIGDLLVGRENVDERVLFGYGNALNDVWKAQYEAGRLLQLKVTAKMFIITKASSMMIALISLLIAMTLVNPVISGELSAGLYMGIVGAVFSVIHQLGFQMSSTLENISRAGEYMKDLTAFFAMDEAEGATSLPDAEPMPFQMIEFRDVRFKYPNGDRYVLDGVSFKLNKGLHYAFVGKNGAGKTTITKLLTGLYTEYEGEIRINGKELRSYPPKTLKALFSIVYQDFARYNISLKDNVSIGDTAGTDLDNRVYLAAKQAGLDDLILKLKNGIETPLGKIREGSPDISGGQWQRVAIARSLISRTPIKILDEPTAALDPISESWLYEEFEKLMRHKTTIFISHRLGSTKLADEIIVIEDGKVIESGTHDKLMRDHSVYAEMFESQRGWYQ